MSVQSALLRVGDRHPANCLFCSDCQSLVKVVGKDYEYACKAEEFALSQCESCGHFFADPMPTREEFGVLYPPTYYTMNHASPLHLEGFIYRQKIARDVRRLLSLVNSRNIQSIVDIGCGDAARLFHAAAHSELGGKEFVGIDLMFREEQVRSAKDAGVTLLQGNVEDGLDVLQDNAFDLAIMSQLVEHLIDPRAALENIRSKLRPQGLLLIETPCVGSGLDYWLFRRQYWGGYHIPRHLHLFTSQSLSDLVRQCGYRVVRDGFLPSPGFWIISLRNWFGLNSVKYSSSLLEFLNFSNLFSVGAFTAFDLFFALTPVKTSNQFALVEKV
ncbi:class I SAM-dependent methyltransferase [Blastopirellula sp. J2-11]|uniref:class I SAM-dependent methyltransferase n=1 Tax=Blastopirellula sp. J2-11 TaxID=2943192 RepID=UPI0021C7B3C6|nr:class I SAM-dependent methyltransferase [Blastopirellula sp. J2-11]UUO06176.1 class I SAM-dependent methyltransferase [Blastopirellula sp. J2-11]